MRQLQQITFLVLLVLFTIGCSGNLQKEAELTYPDGTPLKEVFYTYVGNKKTIVKEIRYFPNGIKELEGSFDEHGNKDGKWIYYYDSGKKWLEENYKSGKKNGRFVEWYLSGKKSFEGNYKNGFADGKWTFWNENGEKLKSVMYKNGDIAK